MKHTENDNQSGVTLKGAPLMILDHLIEGFQVIGFDCRYIYVNDAAALHGQKDKEELTGKTMMEVYPGIEKTEMFNTLLRCMEDRLPRRMENEFIFPDGSTGWFDLRFDAVPEGVTILSLDITEQKHAERERYQNEECYRKLFMDSPDAIFVNQNDTVALVNKACIHLFGANGPNDLIGKSIYELFLPKYHEIVRQRIEKIRASNNSAPMIEEKVVRLNGDIIDVEVVATPFLLGGVHSIQVILRDITLKKRLITEREILYDVLQRTNEADSLEALLKPLLAKLSEWSKCEAVGIRLKEGDDFPYYMTQGFSDNFVRHEKYLCNYDDKGNVLRDEEGKPVLECMCGNILRSRIDPSKSFFTVDGSFWANCTTRLLATSTDRDRMSRTRNYCNAVGYESVALIPLRSGGETLGLIQLNDMQKNRFTEESVRLFRRLADHIANFIAKQQTKAVLAESERIIRLMAVAIKDVFWMSTRGVGRMIYISPAYETLWERSCQSLYQSPSSFIDAVHPDDREKVESIIDTDHKNGIAYNFEYRIIKTDKSIRWILERGFPVPDTIDGDLLMAGVCTDITTRKHNETLLKAKNRELRLRHKCSRILINTMSENDVLGKFCNMFVKDGCYHKAWIDISGTEGARIQPEDQYGPDGEGDDFSLITMPAPSVADGAGNNLQTLKPCKHVAYTSVTPLDLGYGSPWDLHLVALDRGIFSDVESRLITDLSNDICKGIKAIRLTKEHVKTQTHLIESEEKFRILIETSNDAIFVAEADTGIITDANPCALRLLDKPHEDVVGKHQSSIHPPEKREYYRELFENHVRNGTAVSEDVFIINSQGETIPVQINSNIFMLEGKKMIQGIFRNMKERRALEERLR